MKSFTVFNDVHLRGIPQVMNFKEFSKAVNEAKSMIVLNGDCFDFSGCKTKELPALYQEATLLIAAVKAKGGIVLEGNHSCYAFPAPEEYLHDGTILFHHGHRSSWAHDRVEKFMNQEKGAGWFKRNVISKTLASLRRLVAVRPNELTLNYVSAKKKQYPNLKYVVLGHSHPADVIKFIHDGVECRIMPQGMHVLDL